MDRNTIVMVGLLMYNVALRKESVDRNLIDEIQLEFNSVALRKESVDRNNGPLILSEKLLSRSPQGERG